MRHRKTHLFYRPTQLCVNAYLLTFCSLQIGKFITDHRLHTCSTLSPPTMLFILFLCHLHVPTFCSLLRGENQRECRNSWVKGCPIYNVDSLIVSTSLGNAVRSKIVKGRPLIIPMIQNDWRKAEVKLLVNLSQNLLFSHQHELKCKKYE